MVTSMFTCIYHLINPIYDLPEIIPFHLTCIPILERFIIWSMYFGIALSLSNAATKSSNDFCKNKLNLNQPLVQKQWFENLPILKDQLLRRAQE